MSEKDIITALARPRCRIPFGEPDESGAVWETIASLPTAAYTWLGNGPIPRAAFKALAGADALCVRCECALDDPARLRPRESYQTMKETERAWVDISPLNDLGQWWRFQADFKGMCEVSRLQRMPGELSLEAVPDIWQAPVAAAVSARDWQAYHGVEGGRWWVEMVIPWRVLGLRARPMTLGFGYGHAYPEGNEQHYMVEVSWTNPEATPTSLIETGEALLGPDAGAPERLEFAPRFGKSRGRFILGADWPRRPDLLCVRTEGPDGKPVAAEEIAIPAGAADLPFEFRLDRALGSHVDVFQPQHLVLEMRSRGCDAPLYAARLPMDRHLGFCVGEPYGEKKNASANDFGREAWLDRVVRALPRLHRRTTAQGAPSDFCLVHDDGSVAVNLMSDDPWQPLAALVEDRFASAEDRLIAAMSLVGQKSVTNLILCPTFLTPGGEPAASRALHELMGPLSIIRYGGGPAVSRAAVLAGLLQRVHNPATGRPFATRVLSLTREGGPAQVTRRCDKGGLYPFVQRPGPVGAVAVDYGASQTILDPTGLVFFPTMNGKLAAIEEMLSDEALRMSGAGRLAAIYAKTDLEEVRRQPKDRLLSKGVFPELCPDEDGVDRPFEPARPFRPRVVVVGKEAESPLVEGFFDGCGNPSIIRKGAIRLRSSRTGLQIRVAISGVKFAGLNARDRETERVHLAIDPALDHIGFRHFMAGLTGERKLWREHSVAIQTLFKNLSTENWIEDEEVRVAAWNAAVTPGADGYEVLFELPWETMGLQGPSGAIGLNVWVDFRAPEYGQAFLSPPSWRMPADPLTFANVYLNGSPVTLAEVDFGLPTWGENAASVVLANGSGVEQQVTLSAENRLAMRRHVTRSHPVSARIPAGTSVRVEVPYYLDPSEKMGVGESQEVAFTAAAHDTLFYRGSWKINYSTLPAAYERYGSAVGAAANPRPAEKDFLLKKSLYIRSRLPQLKRTTTREGAASDFVLRAEDGSVEFNLMAPGVLDRMGEFVAGRFDNDLDRVLGIFFLSQAPSVARHLSGGAAIMTGAGPLSVMRGNFAGGGGNCGYHSRVFAGMAAHLRINGAPLLAHTVSLWGHVGAAIGWRGSRAVLDADVGHLLMTPDGRDLAIMEEFRSNPDLLSTAGSGDITRYCTFNEGAVRVRRKIPDEHWQGVFPPGAPKQ